MKTIEALLGDYAAADEEKRLSMFLTHKDLRQAFTDLEVAQWQNTEKVSAERTADALKSNSASRAVVGYCRDWLRFCR